MKILTYNIWEGGTLRGGDRIEAIASVIRGVRPDVVGLEEVNDETAFQRLGQLTEMPHSVLGHGIHGYHLGLLSRYPVNDWTLHNDASVFRHGLLETHLATPLGDLTFLIAHLYPGYADGDEDWRVKELAFVLDVMQPYQAGLTLLAGDFNALSPQDTINLDDWPKQWRKHLPEQLRTDAIAQLVTAGYTDCYRALHRAGAYEPGYTLPADLPNVRLDYFFAAPSLAARLQSCQVVTADPAPHASDHLPVVALFGEESV